VLVTDLAGAEKLAGPVAEIQPLVDSGRVTLRLGGHNVSDFTTCDLVVANPAVPKPWENRFLRAAQAAGRGGSAGAADPRTGRRQFWPLLRERLQAGVGRNACH